jgi:type I restriction enzyme S subunit
MSGRHLVKVGNLGRIVTGKTPKTAVSGNYGGSVPFLTPSDDMNIKYVETTAKKLTRQGLAEVRNCLLPPNSICVSCIGSDLGKVAMTTGPTVTNQQINSIIPADGIDADFVYYVMLLLGKTLNYISKTSTAVPIINKSAFSNFTISLPSYNEQRAIAATLSCLDGKIELNRRINANLEAQAQAIFKSWFVDFEPFKDGTFVDSELGRIPKGWRVGTLKEMATITMGQSPKGTSYNESGDGVVFYQGRAEFGWRFPTNRLFTTQPKRMAKKGAVLISVRAPVGDTNIANEDCCIGRGLAAINSNFPSFLFYTIKSLKVQLDKFNGEGTVFGSINKDSLNGMNIIIPPQNMIQDFEKKISVLDKSIFVNETQSRTLVAIRDTLLPKLMIGEIEVGK